MAASFNSTFSMLADLILPDGCGTNNSHIRDWLLGVRNASSRQTHDACIVVARRVQSMGMKSTGESAHVKLHVIECKVNKAPHSEHDLHKTTMQAATDKRRAPRHLPSLSIQHTYGVLRDPPACDPEH